MQKITINFLVLQLINYCTGTLTSKVLNWDSSVSLLSAEELTLTFIHTHASALMTKLIHACSYAFKHKSVCEHIFVLSQFLQYIRVVSLLPASTLPSRSVLFSCQQGFLAGLNTPTDPGGTARDGWCCVWLRFDSAHLINLLLAFWKWN